jgi:hypothetical protein
VLFGVLCLHRERPRAAGFLIAFSFSLKLFSLLLIPYLLWSGRRKAFAWTCVFLAVFWFALPPGVFGWEGSRLVYADWFGRLRHAVDYPPTAEHPILISLHRSAAYLAGGDARGAGLILNAFRALWFALGVGTWLVSRQRQASAGSFGLLADVGLLLLAPVAVSPYLESYHVVPLIIPSLLLVLTAVDSKQAISLRLLAVLFFVASACSAWIPADWELRGLIVNVKLLLAVGGVVLVAGLRRIPGTLPAGNLTSEPPVSSVAA